MTLNQAIAVIEDFGTSHLMINDIIFGAAPEIDTDDLNGYVLWFYLDGATQEETRKSYVFDVRIMDVTQKDDSNEIEAISDSHKLVEDLCAWLDTKQYTEGYQFARDTDARNFRYYSLSDFTGHQFFVEMHKKAEYDVCEVPFTQYIVNADDEFIVTKQDKDRIIAL